MPFLHRKKLREIGVRLGLIPVGNRRNVVGALEQTAVANAYLLYRQAKIACEPHRVADVPAVECPHRRAVAVVIGVGNGSVLVGLEGISEVRCAEIRLDALAVYMRCKAPRAAEVILGAGAAYRREFVVAVDICLYLALAPPVARKG